MNSIFDENLPPNTELISRVISNVDDSVGAIDICAQLICSQQSYSGDFMLKRPESELQIVMPRDPLSTVEIDIDSIPEGLHGYSDLVTRALTTVSKKSIKLRATIYVYQGMSINFHRQSWSAFFGVAGEKNYLKFYCIPFEKPRSIMSDSATTSIHQW